MVLQQHTLNMMLLKLLYFKEKRNLEQEAAFQLLKKEYPHYAEEIKGDY
jgi:hypothetical protein